MYIWSTEITRIRRWILYYTTKFCKLYLNEMSSELKNEITKALELDCNLHQLKTKIFNKYGHSYELKFFRNLKERLKKTPTARNNLAMFVCLLQEQYGNNSAVFSFKYNIHLSIHKLLQATSIFSLIITLPL